MPLLGFQSRFAPLVESGEKRQTIRAYRKDGRDPKPGDRLYLWTGLRTKGARKLGEATAVRVLAVVVHRDGFEAREDDGWAELSPRPAVRLGSRTAFARRDGFESWPAMREWFRSTHGLPFRGLLIEWGEIER